MPEETIEPDSPASAALHRTGFSTTAEDTEGGIVLRLEGELDLATAPILEAALASAIEAKPSAVILDLSDLSFVDSTGIRVLISGGRQATLAGSSITLRSPRTQIMKVLRLTGVDGILPIEP